MDKLDHKKEGKVKEDTIAKKIKFGFMGLIVIAVIALAAGLLLTYGKSYIATVGNEKITVEEYKFFLAQQKSQMLYIASQQKGAEIKEGSSEEAAFWSSNIDGQNALELAKKNAMEAVKELKVQVAKAKEQGLKLEKADQDTINQQVNAIIAQNENSRSKANEALQAEYGINLDQFSGIYGDILLRGKLVEKEMVNVDDSNFESYYNQHPDWFKDAQMRTDAGEALWARHILIKSSSDMTAEDQEKAKKKAEEILQKAKSGEDFAKLAKENSEDGNAQDGGDYVFGKGAMVTEFETAAFALNPGQISELVKTTFGYHIIKLEEKYAQDQPVSLKCAKEYRDYGAEYIQSRLYSLKVEEWKKDPKYEPQVDQKKLDAIQ